MERRVIIPLDGMTEGQALEVAEMLKGQVWGFKVNDLLVDCGVGIITKLKEFGNVMADPKLYDIPNTVKNAAGKIKVAGADLITVHASGGPEMLKEAAVAAPENILAVTILTSFAEEGCREIYGAGVQEKVLQFACAAQKSGCRGIVCSGKELELFAERGDLENLIKVVPGIRPAWHAKEDDQKRVVTPAQAIFTGATLLVIGRPITAARDLIEAIEKTNEEISEALAATK